MKAKLATFFYYLLGGAYIIAFSVYLPLIKAENAKALYINSAVLEYKKANNIKYFDEHKVALEEIYRAGNSIFKETYKEYSGAYSLISCFFVLIVMYFSKQSRHIDTLVLLLVYSVIYGVGSMVTQYYIAVAALILLFRYLINQKIKSAGRINKIN